LRDGANLALGAVDILQPYRYVYAETLNQEALDSTGETSKVDLAYLDRMGVIELTRKSTTIQESVVRAAEEKPKPRKRAARTTATTDKKPTAEALQPPLQKKQTPDEVLSSLTRVQMAVLQASPDDRAVTVDALGGLGHPYGDVIAALTMLEILGLVQKLPGALYTKS
jgi:predicted Rossmann fold nucleotide-binding protein DprA/Smf involved in DNA uptake